MDLDVFVVAHRHEWERLDTLLRGRRRLTGEEADELVVLYQRTAAALAEEGRAAIGMTIGLAAVLFMSGAIEGFVTPSGLPAWARITIGVAVELLFLSYVYVIGRRAALAGETGDVEASDRSELLPTAA